VKVAYTISASATRFAAVAQGRDPAEAIRFLGGLGFEGVELAVRNPEQIDIDQLSTVASELRVDVPAIGTGQAFLEDGLSLTSPDTAVREATTARLLAQADVASQLGALLIVGLIHGPIPPQTEREAALDRLLAGLSRVARAARSAGVRIVIEPVNRYESNWLNTVDEVLEVITRLGEDNVGLLLDTFHMNIEETDMVAALRRAQPRLWHMHVADSNRRAPGMGHLQLAPIVSTLREIGYNAFLSAEIIQHPTLEKAALQTLRTIRGLLPPKK
jgi:sugar phosphate isomerase/epimerase